MSSSEVSVKCESCGQMIPVADAQRGQTVICPQCQATIAVPGADGQADFLFNASDAPAAEHNPSLAPEVSASEQALVFDSVPGSASAGGNGSQNFLFPPVSEPVAVPPADPEAQAAPWQQSASAPTTAQIHEGDDATRTTQDILHASTVVGSAQHPVPTRSATAPRPRPKIPMTFWLIAVLLPTALILVPVSLFVAFSRLTDRPREAVVHPLESIQDDGLYKDYQEGKRLEVISPLTELPKDRPPVKLGETVEVGGLQVTPLEVLRQKVPFSFYRGARGYESYDEVLILRIKLKNVSDIVFHPHDPVFNRAYRQGVQPYSYLSIGEKRFYGIVTDPTVERVRGQNFGELLPEEEMETIFIAAQDTANGRVMDEIKKLSPHEKLIWRVQLRKGRENVRGRWVWATTVVPVEFRVGDIKQDRTANASASSPNGIAAPGPRSDSPSRDR